MKQNFYAKLLVVSLLLLGGASNAWADNTVTVSNGTTSNNFETLNAAFSDAMITDAASDITVSVSADQTLDGGFTWDKAYDLTITPTANITITGPKDKRWFLAKRGSGDGTGNLNIGSDTYAITFDGENNKRTIEVAARSQRTNLKFTNVTFKDFDLDNKKNLIEGENQDLVLDLKNVTLENCKNPSHAFIRNQRAARNDLLVLRGYLNIDNDCKGTTIYQHFETKSDGTGKGGRLKVMGTFTASKQITVVFHETNTNSYLPKTGIVMISSSVAQDLSDKFSVTSDNLSPIAIKYNGKNDMNLAQAYNLELGAAGAATMVLPFEATIPTGTGANCYTLDYTSGDDITATKVTGSTLEANTPVLVIGTANTPYLFETTAAASTTIEAIPGSEQTSHVLTGVYTETVVPANDYILSNKGGVLGFRLADGSTNKVQAYHAYMSVSKVEAGSRGFFGIDLNDGTTNISETKFDREEALDDPNAPVYNMQGVRMNGQTLQKGIYIKNGKKFIVK